MTEPKIRFKRDGGSSFPDWEEHELNYYLSVNADRNIKHEFDKEDVLSVSGEYGVVNQIEFQGRSFAGADVRNYHILYNGDIVYTKSPLKENPFGIIKYNDGPDGIVSTLYAVYHCKDNIVGKLIEYYFDLDSRLNNYLKPLVNIGAKHDMKINNETAIAGTVILPSLPEQQKIADFLSDVDEVIAASEEEVANLEQQKKAVMQKIFSQEVRFKREDGSDFPDWEEMKMNEIFDEIIEKNHPELPVLSVSQGNGTVLRDDSDRRIMYEKTSLKGYKVIKKNDFIIHLRTFEGGLECSNHNGISSPAYRILRSDKLISEAFKDYFRSKNFVRNKLAIAVTGIRDGKNIDMPTFWEIQIPVPSLPEQQLIADFLTSYDDAIAAAKQELEKWKELKKGLLQQMFV